MLPLQKLGTLRPLVWAGLLSAASFGLVVRDRFQEERLWEAAAWAVLGGLLIVALTMRRRGRPKLVPWAGCFVLGLIGYALWLPPLPVAVRATGFVVAVASMLAMLLLPRALPTTDDDPPIRLDL